MAAGDLHRHRGVRQRRVRAHRTCGPPHATRPHRRSDHRSARRTLRGLLADPHGGRRLGVGGPPRAVPDRAPAGLRLHRRTSRQAARRPSDEGEVPSRRVGIRRGIPSGRPPWDPPPRAPRVDRAPAARQHRSAARVPRPPHRDGAAVPGGARRARRGRARGCPATVADALRLGPRALPPPLPGAVSDGIAGGRLPPVRSRRSAIQRGRPDSIPVRLYRSPERGGHPLPRSFRRSVDAAIRPTARTRPEPRGRHRGARGHGRSRRRAGGGHLRRLRTGRRRPHRRHRGDRRNDAHIDQRLVPDRAGRGTARGAGGRGGHRRPRRDRADRCPPARLERARPRDQRGDRVRA